MGNLFRFAAALVSLFLMSCGQSPESQSGSNTPPQPTHLISPGGLGWDDGSGLADTVLVHDSLQTLALRFGNFAQGFNIYRNYTDPTNFARLELGSYGLYQGMFARWEGQTNHDLVLGTLGTPNNGNSAVLIAPGSTAAGGALDHATWQFRSDNGAFENWAPTGLFSIYAGGDVVARSFQMGAVTAPSPRGPDGAAPDTFIVRDGPGLIALRNGTSAEVLRLYNTYSDASNWERLEVGMAGNNFAIKPNKSGSGEERDLELGPEGNAGVLIKNNGAAAWYFDAQGDLIDQGSHTITATNVSMKGTTHILYRCSTAGLLRAGQTTTVPADCGTAVDTGLRVN